MNFGEKLKPICTPFIHILMVYLILSKLLSYSASVETEIEANGLPEVGRIDRSKITYFSLFRP